MRLQFRNLLGLCLFGAAFGQTDLGGGIVTRTDVEHLADLTLDVRDIYHSLSNEGNTQQALEIYLDGRNSEPQVGSKLALTKLHDELAENGISKTTTPTYLFQLFGLADRSTEIGKLAENSLYADNLVRSLISAGEEISSRASLVFCIWMYATHVLYDGIRRCEQKTEADNPAQFDLKGGGFDEFIALWIGTGQAPGSNQGFGLYHMSQSSDELFEEYALDEDDDDDDDDDDDADDDGSIEESYANSQIKLLYQEAAAILSIPDACTKDSPGTSKKLWIIATRMLANAHVTLFQTLIHAIKENFTKQITMYATALVPQAAHCKPSSYKRLKEYLMKDDPDLSKIDLVMTDLYDILACFGLTCDDIGVLFDDFEVDVPTCLAATDSAPMALYRPTTDVHPIARIDLDIMHIRTLTSLGSFDYAKLWYFYGRNSIKQRDSEFDPIEFYSLSAYATSVSRRNAEPMYTQYIQYFDDPNYADNLIRDIFDEKGKWGTKSVAQKSAIITETCAFHIVYLTLLAEMQDAVNSCKGIESQGEFDLTHPWDEVAALLIGSIEGIGEGGSGDVQDGQLTWGLATRRAFQFQTLNNRGYAKINSHLEDLLLAGRGEIDALECDEMENTVDDIRKMSMVPLMQSVVKYAIQSDELTANSDAEDLALGEIYALAILPHVEAVDPEAAIILEENMIYQNGVEPVRDGVKAVADAIGSAAVASGIRCSLIGSTPQANPCEKHSAAGALRPFSCAIASAIASIVFLF